MNAVSRYQETLKSLYESENLPHPHIMSWPLDGQAESDRKQREHLFHTQYLHHLPPSLKWMMGHRNSKYCPDQVLPNCRAVFVSSLGYYRSDDIDKKDTSSRGRVARFARGRDYHKELGKRLFRIAKNLRVQFPQEKFRSFTDIGPLDEVWLAEYAGAAFRGRHGLAIFPENGSWAVIGHILTTLDMGVCAPQQLSMKCPVGCRRCIDACPTGALTVSEGLKPSRCISYQSIEHRGSIEEPYRTSLGDRIFGCDACQEACPFNSMVKPCSVEGFLKNIAGPTLELSQVLAIKNTEDAVNHFAGSALLRASRAGLVRNACSVAGNLGDRKHLSALQFLMNDEDEGVRMHAQWAVKKIQSSPHH